MKLTRVKSRCNTSIKKKKKKGKKGILGIKSDPPK